MEINQNGTPRESSPETTGNRKPQPAFYTVKEAAELLRVGASTLYRIIREGDFPAVRLRSRYVVPAEALDQLLEEAKATGSVVDPCRIAEQRRMAREVARYGGAR